MSFETFIGRRYLRSRSRRHMTALITVLSTVGVAVGVMVLTVVIAVMTGFQSELKSRILGIESHAVVMRYNEWIGDYDQVAANIRTVPGVRSASPFVYAQGMLRSAGGVQGALVRGIDIAQADIRINTIGHQRINRMLAQPTGGGPDIARVVLGRVLAEKLKVDTGDVIMLMAAGARQQGLRRLPAMHRIKVAGLFDSGMYQYDGVMAYMAIDRLQAIMGATGRASGIEVRVDDIDNVESILADVLKKLDFHYWASNWKQMNHNLFSMLGLQKLMMYVILTLIIVVAAFNIASALILMVKGKTRDIAILKAMGASRRAIQKIFIFKGMVIGLWGIVIGIGAGLVVCALLARYQFIDLPGDVYFLTTLPVQFNWTDIGVIIGGTLIICFFASLYPARQAARMNPVDGIRYS